MTRTLTAELGLTTRCAALIALTVTTLILAMTLGAAVLAFLAGTTWGRTVHCDDCGLSLEER